MRPRGMLVGEGPHRGKTRGCKVRCTHNIHRLEMARVGRRVLLERRER